MNKNSVCKQTKSSTWQYCFHLSIEIFWFTIVLIDEVHIHSPLNRIRYYSALLRKHLQPIRTGVCFLLEPNRTNLPTTQIDYSHFSYAHKHKLKERLDSMNTMYNKNVPSIEYTIAAHSKQCCACMFSFRLLYVCLGNLFFFFFFLFVKVCVCMYMYRKGNHLVIQRKLIGVKVGESEFLNKVVCINVFTLPVWSKKKMKRKRQKGKVRMKETKQEWRK